MRPLALALLLVAPGCVIPTPAGVAVLSVTDMMWEGVVSTSEDGQRDVPIEWGEPNALRQVWVSESGLTVTSTWNDGSTHVHTGPIPRELGAVVELAEDTGAEADFELPDAELRVVVLGTWGSPAVSPGQTVSIAGRLLSVEPEEGRPRPLARLGPIFGSETRYSVPRAALLGTGAALLTPATAAIDAAWFVVSLPVVAVFLITE